MIQQPFQGTRIGLAGVCMSVVLLAASPDSLQAQVPFDCNDEAFLVQLPDAELCRVQDTTPFTFREVAGNGDQTCDASDGCALRDEADNRIEVNNLGFRETDGLLYGTWLEFTGDGDPISGNRGIVQIDATGELVELGSPIGLPTNIRFDAGDVSTDGTKMFITTRLEPLYILDFPVIVNRANVEATVIRVFNINETAAAGATAGGDVFDWAYNPTTGRLYGGDRSDGEVAEIIIDEMGGAATRTDFLPLGGVLPTGQINDDFAAYGGAWFFGDTLFLYRNGGGPMMEDGTIYEIDLVDLNNPVPTIAGFVTGRSSEGRNDATACVAGVPEFILEKSGALDPGNDGIINPGDLINYTLKVTNTGMAVLTDVAVDDPLAQTVNCPSGNPIPTLGVGEMETCTASYAITQADIDNGEVCNTGTASSGGVNDQSQFCEPTTMAGVPMINVLKSGSLDRGMDGMIDVGDVINYTVTVANVGPLSLANVDVSDPQVMSVVCPSGNPIPLLGVGEMEVCTASYVITAADIDNGEFCNTATATAGGASDDDEHCEPTTEDMYTIPTLGHFGLALLALGLAGLGARTLRRRR